MELGTWNFGTWVFSPIQWVWICENCEKFELFQKVFPPLKIPSAN